MDQALTHVKTTGDLRNVSLLDRAVERSIARQDNLPAMVAFSGPSGYGKTVAAIYAANNHDAYYVEARSTWTQRAMCLTLLKEMGIKPAKFVFEMAEQAAQQLAASGRPLILDEVDHLCKQRLIEVLRDIYDMSQAPIAIIGEEHLSEKLERWERFHGRVLDWVRAEPAGLEDARHLAGLYCAGVDVADDLLGHLADVAHGSVRRICVNLDLIHETAGREGWREVDLRRWGERALFKGRPAPRPRLKTAA